MPDLTLEEIEREPVNCNNTGRIPNPYRTTHFPGMDQGGPLSWIPCPGSNCIAPRCPHRPTGSTQPSRKVRE